MADSNLTIAPLPGADPAFLARFMAKVNITDGCWLWLGGKDRKGYGRIRVGGRGATMRVAHRVSYAIFRGPVPAGLLVMHSCDTPPCVNPAHLSCGTQKENIEDALAKGRMASGERNGSATHPEKIVRGARVNTAKLTAEKVVEIRRLVASGVALRRVAAMFGVTHGAVEFIVNRRNWRHVP